MEALTKDELTELMMMLAQGQVTTRIVDGPDKIIWLGKLLEKLKRMIEESVEIEKRANGDENA